MIHPEQHVKGGELSWSASRDRMLGWCPRQYFYTYYGWTVDDTVKRLKKLSNMTLWSGALVHDAIEAYLKNHDGVVGEEQQEALIRQVTHGQMPQDFGFSRAGTKKFRLQEHVYGVEIDNETKRVAIGIVRECLKNFFKSEVLREMYEVGKKAWLSIEELCDFSVKGTKVWIKMDAAYRRPDGKVRIVDWKTGAKKDTKNDSQVAGYALYAFRRGWVSRADDITGLMAYLRLNEYDEVPVTLDLLSEQQAKIERSVESMRDRLLDKHNNVARMEDFPQTTNGWACERCEFRGPCKGVKLA